MAVIMALKGLGGHTPSLYNFLFPSLLLPDEEYDNWDFFLDKDLLSPRGGEGDDEGGVDICDNAKEPAMEHWRGVGRIWLGPAASSKDDRLLPQLIKLRDPLEPEGWGSVVLIGCLLSGDISTITTGYNILKIYRERTLIIYWEYTNLYINCHFFF